MTEKRFDQIMLGMIVVLFWLMLWAIGHRQDQQIACWEVGDRPVYEDRVFKGCRSDVISDAE